MSEWYPKECKRKYARKLGRKNEEIVWGVMDESGTKQRFDMYIEKLPPSLFL